MLTVITGGSGSGKSEYAEKLAEKLHKREYREGRLLYIAAMYPYDEECNIRIARHRYMRKEKGFKTIECYQRLERLLPIIDRRDVLLLECMSNLLSNEMYSAQARIVDRGKSSVLQAETAVLEPVFTLAAQAGHVIVVTNEVFSDGAVYDAEISAYVRLLGYINQRLSAAAQAVVEVVCSIPVPRVK